MLTKTAPRQTTPRQPSLRQPSLRQPARRGPARRGRSRHQRTRAGLAIVVPRPLAWSMGGLLGVATVVAIITQAPDVWRYLKIERM